MKCSWHFRTRATQGAVAMQAGRLPALPSSSSESTGCFHIPHGVWTLFCAAFYCSEMYYTKF